MTDYKYLFKIVLVGNAGVGKTCLVRQFTQGSVPNGHSGATIGVDFMIKTVIINNMKIKLQLWDTAGQERFRSITQSYYRSAHCLILVYDISSQPSFDALSKWIRDIDAVIDNKRDYSNNTGNNNNSHVLRVLVGNKCDKEREIPTSIGEKFAHLNKFDFFMETSALDNHSVERLFIDIAEIITNKRIEDTNLNSTLKCANVDCISLSNQVNFSSASASNQQTNDNNLANIRSVLASRAKSCLQC